MYDYAHGHVDALEGITHSICTLEFEDHRPLYDWLLDNVPVSRHPQQIEFARLNLTYTVMSKRKLLELVQEKHVSGWDDPRMPTIAGMRRRGFTPEAIRAFCDDRRGQVRRHDRCGVLEHAIREDLNTRAPRVMGVLRPLKVVIETIRKARSKNSTRQQPRRCTGRARGRCRSPGSCTSSRTTSGKIRRRSSSGSRPAAKCGCGTPTSSSARR